jgi:hypothetical protein
MVLTPRLRTFNIAEPSPMEFETVSESGASLSSRKRQRSVTYQEPPDAPPEDLPELPRLSGESILEVFTHRSLRLACHAKYHDNERLSLLGRHTLETITAQLLFHRRPMLTKIEIEVSATGIDSGTHETTFQKDTEKSIVIGGHHRHLGKLLSTTRRTAA